MSKHAWGAGWQVAALPALALLGSAALTHHHHAALRREGHRSTPAARPLPMAAVRMLGLGHREVLADAYVLQAVQYFGDRQNHRQNYPLMQHLVERASSLDPHSLTPYLLAGTTMTLAGMDMAAALRLLERGAKARPDSWLVPFYGGFTAWYHLDDLPRAIVAFEQAARHADAPPYLPELIARLRGQAAAGDL